MKSFTTSSLSPSKNKLFKRAYLFLLLNWLVFFFVAGLVLTGNLLSINDIFFGSRILQEWPNAFFITANLGALLVSHQLHRHSVTQQYPANLWFMLSFCSFLGWYVSPVFQYIVLQDLTPIILFAFLGTFFLMTFLGILSIYKPHLSINTSLVYALVLAASLLSIVASFFQLDMAEILLSLAIIVGISILHLSMLQRTRAIYLQYGDSNEEAIRLATILFSDSFGIFMRILRILILLSNKNRRRNR